jgi:hypothetical protein
MAYSKIPPHVLAKNRKFVATLRAECKKLGLCYRCREPARPGGILCEEHRRKVTEKERPLGIEGTPCSTCGELVYCRGHRYCSKHRVKGLAEESAARSIRFAIPATCSVCGIWGHTSRYCIKNGAVPQPKQVLPLGFPYRTCMFCGLKHIPNRIHCPSELDAMPNRPEKLHLKESLIYTEMSEECRARLPSSRDPYRQLVCTRGSVVEVVSFLDPNNLSRALVSTREYPGELFTLDISRNRHWRVLLQSRIVRKRDGLGHFVSAVDSLESSPTVSSLNASALRDRTRDALQRNQTEIAAQVKEAYALMASEADKGASFAEYRGSLCQGTLTQLQKDGLKVQEMSASVFRFEW